MKTSVAVRSIIASDRDSTPTSPAVRGGHKTDIGAAAHAQDWPRRDDRLTLWMLLILGISLVGGGIYALGGDFNPLADTGWEGVLTDVVAVGVGIPLSGLAVLRLAVRRERAARS